MTAPVVCVFCSSSDDVDEGHHRVAADLGQQIGRRGWTLLYGGTPTGTMGSLAAAARDAGAPVVGVALAQFVDLGITDPDADELVVVDDLGARKEEMIRRSDVFVGLPGGFGTLDEVVEVISQRQLRMHAKPLVLVDHGGLLAPLLAYFEVLRAQRFAYPSTLGAYQAVPDVETAVLTLARHVAGDA